MNRFRQILRGRHKGFIRYVVAVTLFFLLILTFGSGNNLIHWVQARIEISRQEKQIEMYRREIEKMDERIDMLVSDRDTLEKFARERFDFAAPGDDVYIIEE